MTRINTVAVLGGGNLGTAIARGFAVSGSVDPGNVAITRRRVELLGDLSADGFRTLSDNREAVNGADVVILCVQPQQMEDLLDVAAPALHARKQVVVSTAFSSRPRPRRGPPPSCSRTGITRRWRSTR